MRMRGAVFAAAVLTCLGTSKPKEADDGTPQADPPLEAGVDVCADSRRSGEHPRERAACRALEALRRVPQPTALDLLTMDVVGRRFGVPELADAYDRVRPALGAGARAQLRTFARIADASRTIELAELDGLTGIDQLHAPALHCQRFDPPSDYARLLRESGELGSYMTTHALVAVLFLRANGCGLPLGFDEVAATRLVGLTAAQIDTNHRDVTDLELEAATLLSYVGEAHRIRDGFPDAVLAAQHEDGGFGFDARDRTTHVHATTLAAWYLLESVYPGRREPIVTARHRPPTAATRGR